MSADRLRQLADNATPGPWEHRIWGREDEDWPARRVSVGTKLGHGEAVCISPRYGELTQTTSDAALIALAPDLARWAANARDALDMLEGALHRPLLAEFDRLFGDTA